MPGNTLLVDGGLEFSTVFDDQGFAPAAERYKLMLTNTSVLVSADTVHWRLWPNMPWQQKSMDPGFGLFRATNNDLVATSRPPDLRAQVSFFLLLLRRRLLPTLPFYLYL